MFQSTGKSSTFQHKQACIDYFPSHLLILQIISGNHYVIREVRAIRMSTYVDARSRRHTCCPRTRKKKGSSRAKHEPKTRLERAKAEMPEMLSLLVKTKQCSNEQQLTSNVPAAGSRNQLLWVEVKISENNHLMWCLKKKHWNKPPLFLSFSSSWFLSCSMSLFNLAFSTISFFSSLTLAWATAVQKNPCYPSNECKYRTHKTLMSVQNQPEQNSPKLSETREQLLPVVRLEEIIRLANLQNSYFKSDKKKLQTKKFFEVKQKNRTNFIW